MSVLFGRVPASALRVTAVLVAAVTLAVPAFASPAQPKKPLTQTRAQTLHITMPDASLTVDPALAPDEQNVEFADLLYSGLVRLDPSYHVVLADAARYTVSRDKETYTFYLRRGLRFSNGDPIVANDFKYAIERSLSPALKSPSAPTYLLDIAGAYAYLSGKAKSVSGIDVVNDTTLRITTRWPAPYFLTELTYPTSFALDAQRLQKLGTVNNFSWYSHPISSGPYRLQQWTNDNTVILTANPYALSTPATPRIIISLTAFPPTGVYSYLDRTTDVAAVPGFDSTLISQPGIKQVPLLSIDGIYMNFRHKPFDSLQVRRALTLSLDRSRLVEKAMKRAATPFGGSVPFGQSGYYAHLKVLPYSPALARQALARARKSRKIYSLTLSYAADDPGQSKLARAVAHAWSTVLHLNVTTQGLTLNTLYAKVQSGSLPVYLLGLSADYPSAHDWLALQWETDALDNYVHFHNARFDSLARTADATWNAAKRSSLYNQAQQVLVNDAAWIPLYVPHQLVYVRPTVHNLVVTGYGLIPRNGAWGWVWRSAATPRRGSSK